jgi:hypothetical protein
VKTKTTVIICRICLAGTLAVTSLTLPALGSITLGEAGDAVAPDVAVVGQPSVGPSTPASIPRQNATNVNATTPARDHDSVGTPVAAEAGAVRIMNGGEAGLAHNDIGFSELDLLNKNIEPDAPKVQPQKIDPSTFASGPAFDNSIVTRFKLDTGWGLMGDRDYDISY